MRYKLDKRFLLGAGKKYKESCGTLSAFIFFQFVLQAVVTRKHAATDWKEKKT